MKKAFTIMEMLIIVAVIALLIAMLIPAFAESGKRAKEQRDQERSWRINTPSVIEEISPKTKNAIDIVSDIVYIRESKTGIIYAVSGDSIAIVPGSAIPLVENLILDSTE